MRNRGIFIVKSEALLRDWPFNFFSDGFISHLLGEYANILLRTIVDTLLKTKCNGRFVKNKRYHETGKEYFTIVQMIVKDEGYKHFASRATFDAWSCPPSTPPAPQIPTHTDKKDTFCLMTSAHPSYSPHNFISSSHHDKCISYLITQLQKEKKIYSISLEISHKWNSTVPLFNKSEISIQT